MKILIRTNVILLVLTLSATSCQNFINVDELKDNLLAEQVFDNEATANSAINGIYRTFRNECFQTGYSFSILCGLASDELKDYFPQSIRNEYQNNQLTSLNAGLPWSRLYKVIYQCNSVIEGLTASSGLSQTVRSKLIGEVRFIRAFCYYYLVNLFGDCPLLTTTDVVYNSSAEREPTDIVYDLMISDLESAEELLTDNYIISNGDKVRANRWAATALLARILLYQQRWTEAEEKAASVINSGHYRLLTDIDSIAIRNNSEAILQLATGNTESNIEALFFIFVNSPVIECSASLLNAFEPFDQRKDKWINTQQFFGVQVYYPFKYRSSANGTNENTMCLRLAEQFLIRAEARAEQGKFADAIDDVNQIRVNHGNLNPLPVPPNKEEVINAIIQERRVELFAEGGHRWFDLKRTERINEVLSLEKPDLWKPYASFWPIPLDDIQRNANLKQNEGYENL